MKLIFVDDLPENGHGKYIHYYYRTFEKESWSSIEIKRHIYNQMDSWQAQMEMWYKQLCTIGQKSYKDWWLTDASRLIAWLPKFNQSLFFSVGLIQVCKELGIDELYVIKAPKEVEIFAKDACPNWKIVSSDSHKIGNSPSKIKKIIRPYRTLLGGFVRALKTPRENIFDKKNIKMITYSHLIDYKVFQASGDHFFGNMFDEIEGVSDDNKLWIFCSDIGNIAKEQDILKLVRKKFPKTYVLQDFISVLDFVKIFFRTIGYQLFSMNIKKRIPLMKIDGIEFKKYRSIFHEDLIASNPPIVPFRTQYAFEKIMKDINKSTVFYPFEDKGIERAILSKTTKHKRVAYAHAVHNSGHLYLRQKKHGEPCPVWPDYIGCTGRNAAKWLERKKDISQGKLLSLGTKRYWDPMEKKNFRDNDKLKILVLISQGYEITMFANYVEQDPSIFENSEIIIRKYPFGYHEEQDEGIRRLKAIIPSVEEEGGSLLDQIDFCDVVIYGSTSAAYEAMLCGRVGVCVDIHHIVPLDCIETKGDTSELFIVDTVEGLRSSIEKIESMTLEEYKDCAMKGRDFAMGVYAPIEKRKLAEVIGDRG